MVLKNSRKDLKGWAWPLLFKEA